MGVKIWVGRGMYVFRVVGTFLDAPLHVVSGVTDMQLRQSAAGLTLYAATRAGGGLLSLDVSTGMALLDYATIGATGVLSAPSRLALLDVGGVPAVILTGPDAVQMGGYGLNADGSLGQAVTLPGSPGAAITAEASVAISGARYVYVTPQGTGTLVVGQVSAAGGMTTVQTLALGPAQAGIDISVLQAVTVGGQRMLISASQARNEVVSYAVGADGALTALTRFGAGQGLWVAAPTTLATVEVAGISYVLLGAAGSSSITVLRIDPQGALTVSDHVIDSLDTRFDGVQAMATVALADRVYVIAGGGDDGLTLFSLLPDGRLMLVGTVLQTPGLGMANIKAITAEVSDGGIDIFAAGEGAGITRLRVDPGALDAPLTGTSGADVLTGGMAGDQIYGGSGADSLTGGGGCDLLSDGAGEDVLTGGGEADVFVLSADGQTDTIRDFALGVDRIDLSNWGRVFSLQGLTLQSRADGIAISFGAETLIVETANGASLTAADFVASDLFGLWHLVLPVPMEEVPASPPDPGDNVLMATHGADTLNGGAGFDTVDYSAAMTGLMIDMLNPAAGTGMAAGDVFIQIEALRGSPFGDTIVGGGSDDALIGGAGDDVLAGREGADVLYGGAGGDSLNGGAGDDIFWGGAGSDLMEGGDGFDVAAYCAVGNRGVSADLANVARTRGDVPRDRYVSVEGLLGTALADRLSGNAVANHLGGGVGNDSLAGGGGDDLLIGGAGSDTLSGGAGRDTVGYAAPAGSGVTVDLATSRANRGEARGDRYVSVENVIGTAVGDTLSGNEVANTLEGRDGDDVLCGRGGDDTLVGGRGADRFVFVRGAEGDVIHDFAPGEGDTLALARDLIASGLDAQGVVRDYARIENGTVVLDFGLDDQITLVGVNSVAGLWAGIMIF